MQDTLCWGCKKAVGGCPWADEGKPVEGWNAIPTIVKDDEIGDFESFHVKSCPLFIQDDRRIIKTEEIKEILGVTKTTVNSVWTVGQVIDEMKKKGYIVKYNKADKLWYELRR